MATAAFTFLGSASAANAAALAGPSVTIQGGTTALAVATVLDPNGFIGFPTVSGLGATWQMLAHVGAPGVGGPILFLFYAPIPQTTSGNLALIWVETATELTLSVTQVTNLSLAPFLQFGTIPGTGTTATGTLGAFRSPNNATFACAVWRTTPGVITAGPAMALLGAAVGSPAVEHRESAAGNVTSPALSWQNPVDFGFLFAELQTVTPVANTLSQAYEGLKGLGLTPAPLYEGLGFAPRVSPLTYEALGTPPVTTIPATASRTQSRILSEYVAGVGDFVPPRSGAAALSSSAISQSVGQIVTLNSQTSAWKTSRGALGAGSVTKIANIPVSLAQFTPVTVRPGRELRLLLSSTVTDGDAAVVATVLSVQGQAWTKEGQLAATVFGGGVAYLSFAASVTVQLYAPGASGANTTSGVVTAQLVDAPSSV